MKNRIGHRIWIEKEKKMYYHNTENNPFVLNCKGQVVEVKYAGDRNGEPLFDFEILKDKDYKLMQSICVKDKEGKIMYEKDIVEDGTGFYAEVFRQDWVDDKKGESLHGWVLKYGEDDFEAILGMETVKGNVYEDIGLLEGKK